MVYEMPAYSDGKYCIARPLPNSPLKGKPKRKLCSLELGTSTLTEISEKPWRYLGFLSFTFLTENTAQLGPLRNSPLKGKPKGELCRWKLGTSTLTEISEKPWRYRGFLSLTFRIINATIVHEIQYFTREPTSSGIILNSFSVHFIIFFFFFSTIPSSPRDLSNGDQVWILWRESLGSSSRHACKLGRAIFHAGSLRRDSCVPSLFALLALSGIPIWIWGKTSWALAGLQILV
ncbi:hypothetical protein CEXT_615021 [Caerostris extrusa]|uniref:Cytochrome c biogenesis B n=1 Tax=Caerostris extrusa TaxID=172846 RepID=A0AAV4RWZ0_CAEEX|nr:hypothetical protein CEXT_615021 [Caerostris extrusa]